MTCNPFDCTQCNSHAKRKNKQNQYNKEQAMNIVKILMEREDISREDANEMLWDARNEVLEALENGEDAEAIFTDITGLEPEYMSCIL